jgi:lambda family phage portal protein
MKQNNSLDRIINWLAPGWGLRRSMWRDYQASYRGGIATRLDRSWGAGGTSYSFGTSSDRQQQFSMRERARRVDRDNPIGRTLLNTEVDNVIADGMTLQARTDNEDFNRESEEKFFNWFEVADIRGNTTGATLQRDVYRASRRDGDVGVALINQGGTSRLQIIPGDLISTPDARMGRPDVIEGVEVDSVGRSIAYHVLTADEFGKRNWASIDARDFRFLAWKSEPNQVRGDTCYQHVFGMLDQIDGYIDAVVVAARMGAIFGLIFKEGTGARQYGQLNPIANANGDVRKALTMEAGMLKYIGQDDDIVQVNATQPMTQTPDFVRAMMRQIGQPFDMPLELIAKDMSTVNFSSARIGLLGFYRSCRVKQQWFINTFLSPVYQWWVSREVKASRFKSAVPELFWTHEFMPREWDYTDPVSEAQADLLQIDMGIKSPQMCAADRGRDYEEVQRQIKEAADLRDEFALGPMPRGSYTRDVVAPADPAAPVQPQPDGTPDEQQAA